ncbi:MAG: hypothetical protein ACPF89_11555, partial [Pseudohongiellaceae bacterium]
QHNAENEHNCKICRDEQQGTFHCNPQIGALYGLYGAVLSEVKGLGTNNVSQPKRMVGRD